MAMTDKPDIVEAMAFEIARSELIDKGLAECKWLKDWSEDDRNRFKLMARAALTAALECMREPSGNVLGAVGPMEGFDTCAYENDCDRPHIEWWQAMLSQLRKEALGDENA